MDSFSVAYAFQSLTTGKFLFSFVVANILFRKYDRVCACYHCKTQLCVRDWDKWSMFRQEPSYWSHKGNRNLQHSQSIDTKDTKVDWQKLGLGFIDSLDLEWHLFNLVIPSIIISFFFVAKSNKITEQLHAVVLDFNWLIKQHFFMGCYRD